MRPSIDIHPFLARLAPCAGAAAVALLALGGAQGAHAQTTVEQQALFDRQVSACANNSALPATDRAACLRSVGAEQDRLRNAQAVGAANARPSTATPLAEGTTGDGRATVVQQGGTRVQPEPATAAPETRTTTDGRATLVLPSDSTNRGSAVQ